MQRCKEIIDTTEKLDKVLNDESKLDDNMGINLLLSKYFKDTDAKCPHLLVVKTYNAWIKYVKNFMEKFVIPFYPRSIPNRDDLLIMYLPNNLLETVNVCS